MANKTKSGSERLGRILDRLAEYIQNASGDELLEDARLEGRDPAGTTRRIKNLLLQETLENQEEQRLKRKRGRLA
jgi:hypothetical protein